MKGEKAAWWFLLYVGEWTDKIGGSMSGEMVAILAVGVALVGVILTSSRGLRQDMRDLRQDMARLEARLDKKLNALEVQIGELRERMAHLEGLLEGLRESITGRAAAR